MGFRKGPLEDLEVTQLFGGVYRNTKVLVTGHTGFKGSWLTHWLLRLGAKVVGLALDPATTPNHWDLLREKVQDYRCDIRDPQILGDCVAAEQPEIVFHLAAQPLVRASYADPVGTWSSNLMGTVHLLETCRRCKSVRALVIVTTDKVYEEQKRPFGYSETDPLGGHDPYSASKAACEIAVDSYRKAFFIPEDRPLTATVRAGNVIGGGDWSADRLIPDIIRSIERKNAIEIRYPDATRPWQHVLDCLSGYLLVGERLLRKNDSYAASWNFGPEQKSDISVKQLLELLAVHFPDLKWKDVSDRQKPHEAGMLSLNSEKARRDLGWRPVWSLERAVSMTATWYFDFIKEGIIRSDEQLDDYIRDAAAGGLPWAKS